MNTGEVIQATLPAEGKLAQERAAKDQASREAANYQARVDLAAAYRAVDHYELSEGTCNHLTLRAPSKVREGDIMLVVPFGLHWKEVTASCLLGLDFFTGEVIEGDGKPNAAASCIHRPIHNARYEVDGILSVMHTHQTYTLTLACMDQPDAFKTDLSQNSMRFYNKIAYDYDYDGVANTDQEGERLAKALGDKGILMMGQHGVLTVGKRACDAFDTLYYLERAAQIQVLLMSTGAKMRSSAPAVVKAVSVLEAIERNAFTHFESMKRILADQKPNFMD